MHSNVDQSQASVNPQKRKLYPKVLFLGVYVLVL